MFQLEKMPPIWFLLNILKPNFVTCDWFWADESHMSHSLLIFMQEIRVDTLLSLCRGFSPLTSWMAVKWCRMQLSSRSPGPIQSKRHTYGLKALSNIFGVLMMTKASVSSGKLNWNALETFSLYHPIWKYKAEETKIIQKWLLSIRHHIAIWQLCSEGPFQLWVHQHGMISPLSCVPCWWHNLPNFTSLWSPSFLSVTGLGAPLSSSLLKRCYISLQNEWMNLQFQNAQADLHNITLIGLYISWSADHSFTKTRLTKIRTIALPVHFLVLDLITASNSRLYTFLNGTLCL